MCWKYWQKALQSLFDDTDDIAIQLSVKNPLYTCNNTHIKILIDYMNMLIFLFHKFNYWIRDVSYLTVNHSTRIGFRIICDVANHDNEDMIILCSGLAYVLIFQSICPPCWDTSTDY